MNLSLEQQFMEVNANIIAFTQFLYYYCPIKLKPDADKSQDNRSL